MKQLVYALFASALLVSCQNELYKDNAGQFETAQGVYVPKETGSAQLFLADGANETNTALRVALAKPQGSAVKITIRSGGKAQLDRYNKENNTNFVLLPESMYELPSELTFAPNQTHLSIPVKIKGLQFSGGTYALPLEIVSSDSKIINSQKEAYLFINQITLTKVWKSGGSEIVTMFPETVSTGTWTYEAMVRRSAYSQNNRSVFGSKTDGGVNHEIYIRFGDVTIQTNQLQIKTAGGQIDIPADKLSAKPNEWYMLSFVYDNTNVIVYVNGVEVARDQIRLGEVYTMKGVWIGGANELVREVRIYKSARTAEQIKASVWKMVDPNDENLICYFPLNGKKRDASTGVITEDETGIWDWSKNGYHITDKKGSTFVDDHGKPFRFPLEDGK